MTNVINLIHSSEPSKRACTDCRHFHLATESSVGWEYSHGWLLWLVGIGQRSPTSHAIKYSKCSAFGGGYASNDRASKCHGEYWESNE